VPRLIHDTGSDLAKFSTPADGFGTSGSLASNETPISVTTLKPSALEKIQEFLIRGERRQACHYALDEKLWAHAMVIANSIDRDAWQEAVKEFIRVELGSKDARDDKTKPGDSTNRESLKVAYGLFAGQGAASGITLVSHPVATDSFLTSVQAMLPPAPLSRAVDSKLAPAPPTSLGVTPITPSFPSNVPTNIPMEVLVKWSETVAMMISNSTSPETSTALTAIGDHLSANQWMEAAHVWYGSTSRPHLHHESSHVRLQLPVISTDFPVRWTRTSRDPFGPGWVSQPGCRPHF
jgi:COPII coat assembly protein SEC16